MVRQEHHGPMVFPVRSRGKWPSTSNSQGKTSQKTRRDRRPNWSLNKMIALVDAKREEFLKELDAIDGRNLMDTEVTKWSWILDKIMASDFFTHYGDGMACKVKWHLIIHDYRRVADYYVTNPQWINHENYYVKEIYVNIHEWFGRRPQIQPPSHVCDLLNSHDKVFPRGNFDSVEEDVEVVDPSVNETNIEDLNYTSNIDYVKRVVDGRDPLTDGELFGGSLTRPVSPCLASHQGSNPLGGVDAPNDISLYGITLTQRGSFVLLFDFSHSIGKRKIANTAITRKSLGDVSARDGEAIATQMKKMTLVIKKTESNKLEVQLRLFSEQMASRRECDM